MITMRFSPAANANEYIRWQGKKKSTITDQLCHCFVNFYNDIQINIQHILIFLPSFHDQDDSVELKLTTFVSLIGLNIPWLCLGVPVYFSDLKSATPIKIQVQAGSVMGLMCC